MTQHLIPLPTDESGAPLISIGQSVIFKPCADSPAHYDLDGEYLGRFDGFKRYGTSIAIRVIRQGEKLWLPVGNVFYAGVEKRVGVL